MQCSAAAVEACGCFLNVSIEPICPDAAIISGVVSVISVGIMVAGSSYIQRQVMHDPRTCALFARQ